MMIKTIIFATSYCPNFAFALLDYDISDDENKNLCHNLLFKFIFALVYYHYNVSCLSCRPICAEIVPEKSRTSIYALDMCFKSVLSSFAPPIVGILAQRVFGYRADDKGKSIQLDRENAASLAKALYTSIAIPFTICTSIYSFLYCSYPRDRERARMQSLIESELQQMEQESFCLEDGDCRFQVFDSANGELELTYDVKDLPDTEKDTAKLLANRES
jgi:hypothetical protein